MTAPIKRDHWMVRMNHRNRAACFVFLFLTVASHMWGQGHGFLAWTLVAIQYLLTPQLMFLWARRAADQRAAEFINMRIDALLFGICVAALGFPLWIGFILFVGATVNFTVFRGPRGFIEALIFMVLGAVLTALATGAPLRPETSPLTTGLAIACVSLYLWIVAQGAYVRATQLHQAREKLRLGEQALQEANRVLRLQNEAKTRFLAYAGHDLRQPLQAIHLFLASLRNAGLDAHQSQLADMVARSTRALSELLDSLLDISRLDAGAVQADLRLIDVVPLLEALVLEFDPQARARRLRLKFWHPPRAVTIRTDPKLLASVLRNLLSNAIKYTPRGGVMLALRRRGPEVRIQVWDTGVGIDEENRALIFEEFYQVNNPQRDREQGLGLGLSIVRRLVTLLGIELRCASRPGRGTCMELVLPAMAGETPPPPTAAPAPAAANLEGRRVMVVEDTLEVAQALAAWFEQRGARVILHVSAEAALADDAIEEAEVLVSDYRLPGAMNGIAFLDAARARCRRPPRAVLLTGDTSAGFIEMATASGWPILFKPVDASRLAEILAD